MLQLVYLSACINKIKLLKRNSKCRKKKVAEQNNFSGIPNVFNPKITRTPIPECENRGNN